VKEKQVGHLKAVIALQDKLKGNQHRVNYHLMTTEQIINLDIFYR
jgi:hypothetical protein